VHAEYELRQLKLLGSALFNTCSASEDHTNTEYCAMIDVYIRHVNTTALSDLFFLLLALNSLLKVLRRPA
jgi:hypothetical protein